MGNTRVMRLLLDTHVFMWWVDEPSRVKSIWVEPIVDPDNQVYVSAISALEIETKKRIGKLQFGHDVADAIVEYDFSPLAITTQHGSVAGQLEWSHSDPFDRVLVAQALTGDMLLLTEDNAVRSAPWLRVL